MMSTRQPNAIGQGHTVGVWVTRFSAYILNGLGVLRPV